MASVRQKSGKWYYRITITDTNGKHRYIERGSFNTKREAQKEGNKAEVEYKTTEVISRRKNMSFYFLSQEWLRNTADEYKISTLQSHEKELRSTILPYLKDFDINAITLKNCQNVIDKAIKTNHSRNRLTKIRATMNKCFAYAVRNGYLKENPARDVKLPAPRSKAALNIKTAKDRCIISKEEAIAILNRFPEGHPCYIPLLLGYRCGLRLGEAYGLLINDVDLDNKVLHIRRQIQYEESTNELYFTQPKYCLPGQGRDVRLDDNTVKILRKHINKIESTRISMGHLLYFVDEKGVLNTERNGEMIFLLNVRMNDGSFIAPRTMRHVSRVVHGKTGKFDCVNPTWDYHTMRHTHASECVAAGMDPVSVQKRLGHKNLQTTYRYYIHETEEQQEESKQIINSMFK